MQEGTFRLFFWSCFTLARRCSRSWLVFVAFTWACGFFSRAARAESGATWAFWLRLLLLSLNGRTSVDGVLDFCTEKVFILSFFLPTVFTDVGVAPVIRWPAESYMALLVGARPTNLRLAPKASLRFSRISCENPVNVVAADVSFSFVAEAAATAEAIGEIIAVVSVFIS